MPTEHVQTKHEIEQQLKARGLRPRKRLGQHFLIDGNLMRRLTAAAELQSDDVVLEVGGGTGGLTDLLVARAGRVVCVEADRQLHALLAERYAHAGNLTLIHGDILERKHRIRPEVIERLHRTEADRAGEVKLVANLPYQVATPLVMNLLIHHPFVRRLCFTVQAEVGDRITADPGGKAYGPLGIVCRLVGDVQTLARIPPQAFWPRPAVHSTMLRIDTRPDPAVSYDRLPDFARMLRAVFEHRRKTLRATLGFVVDPEIRDRITRATDGSRRPESLDIPEWVRMFDLAWPRD